ncbi:MAG TPA: hypothetical protein VJJ75_00705 [Candidatus Nanoarchaeia archaeon]|nr:hypothetical protein [Candidatus Nanoarchaeia archaeon]
MLKIILDTDFLLNCLRWKIDINKEITRILDEQFEICILSNTLEELKGKKDEKLANAFIQRLAIISTGNEGKFDKAILSYPGSYVATQDKDLKEKLKKANFGIITIRQKSHLQVQNVL